MLKLENITKSFGEKILFRDFSYNFEERGIYALKGKSGIGKTTLLRIIAGLDKDFSGNITGGGISNSSICFQEHRLFPTLTAIDNLLKVSFKEDTPDTRLRAHGILSRLSFSVSDMLLYPDQLSGGMKQRIAFARAVLRNSPILLLDEATKELDSSLADEVLNIIREEGKKRLVIMVTHKDDEIKAFDSTVISLT